MSTVDSESGDSNSEQTSAILVPQQEVRVGDYFVCLGDKPLRAYKVVMILEPNCLLLDYGMPIVRNRQIFVTAMKVDRLREWVPVDFYSDRALSPCLTFAFIGSEPGELPLYGAEQRQLLERTGDAESGERDGKVQAVRSNTQTRSRAKRLTTSTPAAVSDEARPVSKRRSVRRH